MKKNLLLIVFILISAFPSLAQRMKHGLGTSMFFYGDKVFEDQVGLAITWSPVCFFAEKTKTSFSVGIPAAFGLSNGMFGFISHYEDGRSVESHTKYMLHIPVIFNFNFGAGAVGGGKMKHGFFVGGGPAFNVSPVSYFQYGGEVAFAENGHHARAVVGGDFNAGWRVAPGNRRSNLEVKISTFKGFTGRQPDMVLIGCIFNF